ncbi:MAG: diacylglycerol kinase family protein [Acidimicrobiales bacterium]
MPSSPRELDPRARDGSGLSVVVNPTAGPALGASLTEQIAEAVPAATVRELDEHDDLLDVLRDAARSPVLGVAGGDGTINAATGIALETDRPLLVIPGGTLNHFARDLGVDTIDAAIDAFHRGRLHRIDVGRIDGRPFLNTASIGGYPELVDERERLEGRLGKWLALAVAMVRVTRRIEPTLLTIDGVDRDVWLIFVGNCVYDPPGLAPRSRSTLDDGRFDVRYLDAGARSRSKVFLALLTGQLGRTSAYRRVVTDRLDITSRQGPLRLARDGETFDGGVDIVIEKDPVGLDVFLPAEADR